MEGVFSDFKKNNKKHFFSKRISHFYEFKNFEINS